MKRFFMTVISLLVATSTAMASTAYVTTDLNLRASPDTRFRPIIVLPAGALVDVRGCVRSYRWCRVSWRGYDGWAYSRYLATRSRYRDPYYNRYPSRYRSNFDDYAVSIGIPIIAGIIIGSAISNSRPHRHYRYYDRRDRRWYRRHRHR
jgi:uncharacterized protein YraI